MTEALTAEARALELATLTQWTYDPKRRAIHRRILVEDFSEAFGLMTRIAIEAERSNHHPEWFNCRLPKLVSPQSPTRDAPCHN